MIRIFKSVAKFAIVMSVMTVVCTIVWQNVVTEYLYDNTDDNIMGFVSPIWGDFWIGEGGFPVVAVQHVVHGRSMSDPDEIKVGWSVPKLFCLWLSFVTASTVISILLARIRWLPKQSTNHNYENVPADTLQGR
jgi:hypothetical protein